MSLLWPWESPYFAAAALDALRVPLGFTCLSQFDDEGHSDHIGRAESALTSRRCFSCSRSQPARVPLN
jgi:hypothetical protein